ncbi:unnamed protein product [Allacma fusca]|uniref:Alpha-carbonic anhydrase domain-containing protein n=1 Tax=Allacma fusca TaxID=39272 RepID=A0A8J2L4K0_9HEXA|nr:unnamed protein product [Allacma fusca]
MTFAGAKRFNEISAYLLFSSLLALNCIFLSSLWTISQVQAWGNKAHNNFIRHTYTDNDPLGPQNWKKLESGPDITNFCSRVIKHNESESVEAPATPLNIVTKQATLPIRDIEDEFELDEKKPSITFQMRDGLENVPWQFGYPTDIYYGLEIRGPRLGLIQILDSYDPPFQSSISYDFNFASISFCDFKIAAKERTSHQLNGKRFPLEINMVFISEPRDIGIDNNLPPKNNQTQIIMVSVLGEAEGKRDNVLFDPVIKAAKSYKAGNFDMDDTDENFFVNIGTPFSPTWLLPEKSTYYYYRNGTFPVPPCFPMAQVYVFNTPIKISMNQLEALTTLKSEREPDSSEMITGLKVTKQEQWLILNLTTTWIYWG